MHGDGGHKPNLKLVIVFCEQKNDKVSNRHATKKSIRIWKVKEGEGEEKTGQ